MHVLDFPFLFHHQSTNKSSNLNVILSQGQRIKSNLIYVRLLDVFHLYDGHHHISGIAIGKLIHRKWSNSIRELKKKKNPYYDPKMRLEKSHEEKQKIEWEDMQGSDRTSSLLLLNPMSTDETMKCLIISVHRSNSLRSHLFPNILYFSHAKQDEYLIQSL